MTVTNETCRIVYTPGDGVTLVFPFPYYFFANSNLVVTKKLIASPYTETVLVLDTDYSVTGASNPAGGTVTLVAVVAATYHLIIERIMPLTQVTDYVENDSMPAETLEASLDKIVMITQQLQAQIDEDIALNLPTLVPGYLYNDGTALSWSTITTTAYPGDISRGLDAAKAAVPSAGDIYIATDTGRFYICYVAGTWSNNIYLVDLTAKVVLVDNDLLLIEDSAASYVNKKITRANLKADITDACVKLTGNQTVNGIKTLGSLPIGPSVAPTANYEMANKKYVDDEIIAGILAWDKIYDQTITAQTSVTISSLNGDVEMEYHLLIQGSCSAIANIILLRPNNDSAATSYGQIIRKVVGDASPPTQTYEQLLTQAGIVISETLVAARYKIEVQLAAISGIERTFFGRSTIFIDRSANYFKFNEISGGWMNTANNITSLVIVFPANFTGRVTLFGYRT